MSASLETIFISLKQAQTKLAVQNRSEKDQALAAAAAEIDKSRAAILEANVRDMEQARKSGMKESLVDRLLLNDKRIDGIIEGIEIVIRQEDPIGKVQAGWTLPNGLQIEKVTVPLGTAAIIYESRPNVTVDCAALAYKAGCSILLRGSSSALESNKVLVRAIKAGLTNGGGIADAVELAQSGNRDEIDEILVARDYIDAVLPRGGHELIRRVVENARVPVIETGEGNCHIYVELPFPYLGTPDINNVIDIILNAKLQKPGVCNAVETLLVHNDSLNYLMPELIKKIAGKTELRCDKKSKEAMGIGFEGPPAGLVVKDATEEDWETEFLDYILAVKTVGSCEEAIAHINRYGTKHSEAIITENLKSAEMFKKQVDAACVYVNASTRFTDGGQFGFGAELGISTQKFHARGPMGLDALTTIKYLITGSGQIRE
ncbi:MAG: glutamate-5-semialdehyde dehydrogenase [Treponema sp.]|nr:glutamate-5-semialdehyde dehydrogenase [Treponema sp.]MCL2251032.1 glutamate-5-semialdehyde dehydrogenase [Treponema sp.]